MVVISQKKRVFPQFLQLKTSRQSFLCFTTSFAETFQDICCWLNTCMKTQIFTSGKTIFWLVGWEPGCCLELICEGFFFGSILALFTDFFKIIIYRQNHRTAVKAQSVQSVRSGHPNSRFVKHLFSREGNCIRYAGMQPCFLSGFKLRISVSQRTFHSCLQGTTYPLNPVWPPDEFLLWSHAKWLYCTAQ